MIIGFWHERINGIQAISVLDKCMEEMFNQEKGEICVPPGGCKTFIEALQFSEGRNGTEWFLQYNDHLGSTKSAVVKISDEEMKQFNIVDDFIV